MYGSPRSNQQFRAALADRLFSWLLGREDIMAWLDEELMRRGTDLFHRLDALTAHEVGRVLLGMNGPLDRREGRWGSRTLTGSPADDETFFTKKVKDEVARDPFLASCVGKDGVPVTKPCFSMVGEAVKRTRFYKEGATEMRRSVNRNRALREVMEA